MPLLRTLGRLMLQRPDGSDAGGRRMILALLAWLARQRHRAAHRERLVSVFWERQEAAAGRHSLRQALSEVRSLLPGVLLDSTPDQVALTADGLELDAERFEVLVARRDWRGAIECYGGEFLAGLDDLGGEEWRSWLEGERASLRRQADAAYAAALQEASGEADWNRAVTLAEQWSALSPGEDRPVAALVRALLAADRPAEAAGRLAGHLERVRAEGSEPSAELQRLATTVRAPAAGRARGLLTPDLVGRQDPFARLTAAWQAVIGNSPGQVLLIEADDGLGKTRLLEEFVRWVRTRGQSCVVIEHRAHEGEAARARRGLAGVLDQLEPASGLAAASSEDLAILAGIAPRLRTRFPGVAAVATDDVAPAVVRVLTEVCHELPTLLVLDDADRLDTESAAVLAFLALHMPARLLLVVSSRPGRLGDGPFSPVLREARAAGRALHLQPLAPSSAVELVASMGPMDPAAAKAIGEAAVEDLGGSPATIHLLVTELADRGLLRPGPTGRLELAGPLGRPLALPEPMRDRWTRLVRELAPAARTVVQLVAAAPGPAGMDQLEQASALGQEALQEAIGDLLSRRLIRRAPGDGIAFECASEELRRSVLDTVPPRRQAALRAALSGDDRAMRRRKGRWAASAALGLAVLLLAVWAALPARPPRGELSLLVADVHTDSPEDADLARPILLAAMTELQEGARVRPAPRSLVRDAVIRMGRPGADSLLDEALAVEVAVREGIELVAVLEVDRTTAGRELRYRLLEASTGDLIDAGSVRADTDQEVLPAANRLLRELRSALSGAGGVVGDAAGYPRVSTHSLAALRHYTAGSVEWTARAYGRAANEWRAAVALDSGFALAWASLAGEAFRVQNTPLGREYLARARAHADRLTPRERLQLQAVESRWLGSTAEAIAAARSLATSYPDRDSWYNLGTSLLQAQRCDEAIPALRRALDHDPAMTAAHVNVATCFQFLQQPDSAVASYHLARATDSTVLRTGNIGVEYGMALRMLGQEDGAARHYEVMRGWGPEWNRGFATRQMAWMAMARGEYRSAAVLAGRAVEMQRAGNSPLGVFRDRMLQARALIRAGDSRGGTELRGAWRERPDSLLSISLLWPFVELARQARLRPEAEAIRRRALDLARPGVVTHEPLVAALRATAALDRGDARAALDHIEEAWPRPAGERWGYLDLVRAEALERAGAIDSALAQWRRIADSRWVGWETEDYWNLADLEVARLAALRGRNAEAMTALNRLLERWRGGDEAAPALVAARRLHQRLLAEERPEGGSGTAGGPR